jgi:hypothetical protein
MDEEVVLSWVMVIFVVFEISTDLSLEGEMVGIAILPYQKNNQCLLSTVVLVQQPV